MPTIQDKILLQAQNPSKVFLFKEGIFYKVYNQGAYLMRPPLRCSCTAAASYLNFIFENHLKVCNLGAPLRCSCTAAASYLNFMFENHPKVGNLGAKHSTSSNNPSPYQ